MSVKELLFGKPLKSDEEKTETLSSVSAIPVVGLDALASAAYGPEAALTILLALGNASSGYMIPISVFIIALLAIVALSYRQTIPAYPKGGGSFTVAKENLGLLPGLLAATALCLDYVLNVAVAISAGVAALASAVPQLLPYTLDLCLGILLLLTMLNLRGIRSTGLLLLLPTYLFIGCIGTTIGIGIWKLVAMHGHPIPVQPPPHIPSSIQTASGWLLLRAFASGCTALTGVEAVSNAVPIFKKPSAERANRTLTVIMGILALMLAGIAVLVHTYGISATSPGQRGYQSVLSQMLAAVVGRGPFYYLSISAILAVLLLSADTSFTGFPRVCQLLAQDDFLPAEFAHRGRRLAYSWGILILAILSGLLLILFGGVTDRLIPLFAVGAFSAFTLSQLGMVFHWRKSKKSHATHAMIFNGTGALATGITLAIIAVAKFVEGAWITILLMPLFILLFQKIRKYQEMIERKVEEVSEPLDLTDIPAPIVVVPMKRISRVTGKALREALSLGGEVHAVQIVTEEVNAEDLTQNWRKLVEEPAKRCGQQLPHLEIIQSPYREFFDPLLAYVNKLSKQHPGRPIAVMIPELVEKRWYNFLFRHRATLLKELLLLRCGPEILVVNSPWYLQKRGKAAG
ncbi:APC family permease [Geomonas sp.]|uniref:APC family permease n=1 Tax=Geomonas sp. TaxID=2651584 RepID=UPI002B484D38|nr:APC family permease [Geomonas sp.]HJV35834.1 APC family permease [Geomonas sp.]